MTNNIEIMSPVGSWESLMAAVQGGAGSVYFGVGNLNMRSKSTFNFTINDLHKIVEICNENQIKSYLTINTIIYDSEVEQLHELVDAAKEANVTAIIASDLAVMEYAKQKQVEIHASTQLNISNFQAVKFFSSYCDVMVLARELTIEQTGDICKKIREQNIIGPKGELIRIEIFVHGALCMSISGKCYISLHENNHSANRGSCLQNCRRSYEVTEKESGYQLEVDNEYIMSPKDLCTVHILDKILDAGVTVLKIEGRARAPEYVKLTTCTYREAVDAWKNKQFTQDNVAIWTERLRTIYNRGFWEGYYLGERLGQWSYNYGSSATRRKEFIGKITNYFKRSGVAEITLEAGNFSVNDDLFIIGPTTGVLEIKPQEIRCNDISVDNVSKGDICSIITAEVVRRNDKVYKWILT